VLLLAATNVAKLQLVRALSRTRELATRAALGATRLRLVRQLFAEGLLLSALGGVVGVLLATWGTRLVVAASPIDTPRLTEARIDGTVVVFSLVVTLATSLACSVLPALQASRIDLNGLLKEGGRSPWAGGLPATVVAGGSAARSAGRGQAPRQNCAPAAVDQLRGTAVAMDLLLAAGHGVLPHARCSRRSSGGENAARRGLGRIDDAPSLSGESGVRSLGHGPPSRSPVEDGAKLKRQRTLLKAMGMTFVRGRGFTAGDTTRSSSTRPWFGALCWRGSARPEAGHRGRRKRTRES
jgi:hypothetical protein